MNAYDIAINLRYRMWQESRYASRESLCPKDQVLTTWSGVQITGKVRSSQPVRTYTFFEVKMKHQISALDQLASHLITDRVVRKATDAVY